MTEYECGNCGRYFKEDQLVHVFPDIPDLAQRVEPGGVVPAGECPECGALAYPRRDDIARFVRGALIGMLSDGVPPLRAAQVADETEVALCRLLAADNHLTLEECRDRLAAETGVRVNPWTIGRALRRLDWT